MQYSAASATQTGKNSSRKKRFHRKKKIPMKNDKRMDLNAKWIWIYNEIPPVNYYLYARKTFKLTSKPKSAIINITADSKYKLFVNGEYVGKGSVRAPIDCFYVDTHNIEPYLKRGNNVIAVLVHHFGENSYSYIHKKAGLICEAKILSQKEEIDIASDNTWKVKRAEEWTNLGAKMSRRLGFQEVYDTSLETKGWNTTKFRDTKWQNAVEIADAGDLPWGELIPREIPLLAEEKINPFSIIGIYNSEEREKDIPPSEMPEVISNSALTPIRAGSVKNADSILFDSGKCEIKTARNSNKATIIILDFAKEVFGNIELGFSCSGSGIIDLGYSELLEEDKVKPNKAGVRYTDRIILKKGSYNWQSFEPRGFRYIHLEFRKLTKSLQLEYVRVNQTTFPVEHTGGFLCNDDILNKIWEVGRYTTQLCMEDSFIDCPWRERAQWWADARVQSRVAFYVFGDTSLLAQGIRQIASSQKQNGMVCGMYPSGYERILPDFALLWVYSIMDYYAYSNDFEMLKDQYPKIKKLLNWFKKFRNKDGLLENVPEWVFIDWCDDMDLEGTNTSINSLYCQTLNLSAAAALILGYQNDFENYSQMAIETKISLNKYLYVPSKGLYAETRKNGVLSDKFTRQANILAVLCDIADHYQKSTIVRCLLGNSLPELITPYFTTYFLEALYYTEKHEEALEHIKKRWGNMINAGATTFWEQFSTEGSLCHGWSCCPTRDLIAEYVGIKPVLGSNRFAISPHPANLKWARGWIKTSKGRIYAEWNVTRNSFNMTVDIPNGQIVDIYPPISFNSKIVVDGKNHPSKIITFTSGTHNIKVCKNKNSLISTTSKKESTIELVQVEKIQPLWTLGYFQETETRNRKTKKSGNQNSETEEIEEVLVEENIISDSEAVATLEPENQEKKKPSRSRRRKTKSTNADANPSEPKATLEEIKTEPLEQKKKAVRRNRRRAKTAKPATTENKPLQETISLELPEVNSEPVPAQERPVKKNTNRRYRRPRRKKQTENNAD
ncbi:MAG: family 78 glycoside hydrolase catalytic domain [Armatimonadota bacterium]